MITDQYYSQEDEPNVDNPETALDLYQQSAASLADYPAQAAQSFREIEETITPWYNQAVANGDAALQQQLIGIHSRAQHLNDQVNHLDALAASAAVTMNKVNEKRVKAVMELSELTEAIDNIDIDHPKLGDALEVLEEIAYENMEYTRGMLVADEAAEMADEMMYDRSYNTVYNLLHMHAVSDHAIGRLREALLDVDNEDGMWSPERLELLIALARTFEPHVVPVDLDGAAD